MANYKDFSAKVKSKYPQYKDVPDDVLAKKMIEKYPEYKDQVEFDAPKDIKKTILEDARARYSKEPFLKRMALGAGKQGLDLYQGARNLIGLPDENYKNQSDFFEKVSSDDKATMLGGVASDFAMLAIPSGAGATTAMKLMKVAPNAGKYAGMVKAGLGGLGAGVVSSGAHQIQNIGQGEDVSGKEIAGEVGLSTIIPSSMLGLGQYLKKVAPEVLQTAIKPLRKHSRKINAPQFAVPLKQGDVKYFGGVEGLYKNILEKSSRFGEARDQSIKQANIKVNVEGALQEAQKMLERDVQLGKIDANQYYKAIDGAGPTLQDVDWYKAKYQPKQNLVVDGSEAIDLKKKAGKRGVFNKFDPSKDGDALFSEAFSRAINNQIDRRVTQKNVPETIRKIYQESKKELSKYTPIKKAIEDANPRMANNYGFGLMDAQALQVGQGMMTGNLPKVAGATAGFGLRRLSSTVGGSGMLYDAGNALEQSRPLGMQALRSSLFSQ